MTKQELEEFADFQDGDRVWMQITRRKPDGTEVLIRRNMGFSALELGGMAALALADVAGQMRGTIKPDIIKREVSEQAAIERDEEDRKEEAE